MLVLGIVWILYGIAGVTFGFGHVSRKYRGYVWTNDYVRAQGISFIMLGAAFAVLYFINIFWLANRRVSIGAEFVVLFVLASPSFVYMLISEKKFKARLRMEKKVDRLSKLR